LAVNSGHFDDACCKVRIIHTVTFCVNGFVIRQQAARLAEVQVPCNGRCKRHSVRCGMACSCSDIGKIVPANIIV